MYSMKILDDVVSTLNTEPRVKDIRQGLFHTGVLTDRCGLAATLPRDALRQEHPSVREPGGFLEKSTSELIRMAYSDIITEAAIGMAAINSLLEVDENRCLNLNAGDIIAERGAGKKVAIVGHFPFIPDLRKAAKELWVIENQYLLGDDLIIAPVVVEGARERTVQLPGGSWYDFYSGDVYQGGGRVKVAAPLERIPVLVRAGAVLPLEEGGHLRLHIYRSADGAPGSGVLYSDKGDGFGKYRVDRFRLDPVDEGGFQFSWEIEGNYSWRYASVAIKLHGFSADAVMVDGKETLLTDDSCEIGLGSGFTIPFQSET